MFGVVGCVAITARGIGGIFRRRRINDLATVLYCTPLDSLLMVPSVLWRGGNNSQSCTSLPGRVWRARGQRPFDAPEFSPVLRLGKKYFLAKKKERVSQKKPLRFPNRQNMPLPRLAFIPNFEGLNARKVRLILTLSKLPNFFSRRLFFSRQCVD